MSTFPTPGAITHLRMQLIWKALKFVKGRHNNKTLSFVKSVLAFIAITIPDIDDPFQRMKLYQTAGLAALHNTVCTAPTGRR
jgi:hypothetical protein